MKKTTVSEYSVKLGRMRGRRTQRTLDDTDLMQALAEARRYSYGNRYGSTVANCYVWRAYRMVMAAIKLSSGRGYAVRTCWANATKGSSRVPEGGRMQDWLDLLPWRRSLSLQKLVDAGYSILTCAEVTRAMAEVRLRARVCAQKLWPEEPDYDSIMVTVADSLAAGNCERVTATVRDWFPGLDSVSATTLRRTILARDPMLARYGKAAVDKARSKQGNIRNGN